jgi:hypothetical protein
MSSTKLTNMKPTKPTRTTTHTDWKIARRDLLKYLGVGAACLPMLSPERAHAATAVGGNKKLIVILTSEGYRQQFFKPMAGPLMPQKLPETLAPLEPHKADLVVMPDLANVGFGTGASGGHGSYGSIFYGLDPGRVSYKRPKGSSFDQVIAQALGKNANGRPTLPLHIQLERSPQSNPSAPASNRAFWLGGQPINPIGDPYQVYMEIFGNGAPAPTPSMTTPTTAVDMAEIQRLFMRKKSILDYVGKNLDAFRARVGTSDKMAIDAHHESVRQLEMQLSNAGAAGGGGKCDPHVGTMININDGAQYPAIFDAHMWLMVDALKCGITKIASLQLSDSSGNNINFAFVPGIPAKNATNYKTPYRNYHDLGHNPLMNGVDHKKIVDRWMMERFAILLDRMKAVPEDGGTLLSNSAVLFGNHMQDGSNHDASRIPWVMAGSLGGTLRTGICLPEGKPTNGVMTEICTSFGVMSPFGYPLPELRAA